MTVTTALGFVGEHARVVNQGQHGTHAHLLRELVNLETQLPENCSSR